MGLPAVGLICQPGLEGLVDASRAIDIVEIEPQISWIPDVGVTSILSSGPVRAARRSGHPILLHSIAAPLGGSIEPDRRQRELLADLVDELRPPWISEHLSILDVDAPGGGRRSAGVLMAPPHTRAAVDVAARNIDVLCSAVDVPVIFETEVNYLRPRPGELPDGEFFASIAERADCGILVDLHNLWCNELNGRQPAIDVLETLPPDRVVELHVAAGYWRGDHYLDAHSGPTGPDVLSLLETALDTFPDVRAVVFEVSPDRIGHDGLTLDDLAEHLDELRTLVTSGVSRPPVPRPSAAGRRSQSTSASIGTSVDDVRRWEAALAAVVLGAGDGGPLADELAADTGSAVWRDIAQASRCGQFVGMLPSTARLLMLNLGERELLDRLEPFWARTPVGATSADEARNAAAHVVAVCSDVPLLREVIDFELALHECAGRPDLEHSIIVPFDPNVVIGALDAGRIPADVERRDHRVVIPSR